LYCPSCRAGGAIRKHSARNYVQVKPWKLGSLTVARDLLAPTTLHVKEVALSVRVKRRPVSIIWNPP